MPMPLAAQHAWTDLKTKAKNKPNDYIDTSHSLCKGWGVEFSRGEYTNGPTLFYKIFHGTEVYTKEHLAYLPKPPAQPNQEKIDKIWDAHKAFQ